MCWLLMCWGARKELEEDWNAVMQARQYKPLTRQQHGKKPVMVRNSGLAPTTERVLFVETRSQEGSTSISTTVSSCLIRLAGYF